jgi:hypothetical protein
LFQIFEAFYVVLDFSFGCSCVETTPSVTENLVATNYISFHNNLDPTPLKNIVQILIKRGVVAIFKGADGEEIGLDQRASATTESAGRYLLSLVLALQEGSLYETTE